MRLIAAVTILAYAPALHAETRFLPGSARELSLETSASRDAPVLEYAHGRRAYGSLGAAPGVVAFVGQRSTFRIGLSGLFAWENDAGAPLLPKSLLWRDREALSLALSLDQASRTWFGRGARMELGLELGHEGAHYEPGSGRDAWRSSDIAFGAGGFFLAPDVALRLPAARRLTLTSRLGDRIYVNALPRAVGQREASDYVADAIGEGLLHAAFADLDFRWADALLSLHAEALLPHDDNARSGVRTRLLAGLALPGEVGELIPFFAADAGNGYGYFVNRRELQVSLGLRWALVAGGGK